MKWLAILFSLLIILIIVLADMGALPHFLQVWKDLPYGDKAGHFILYGILTLLVDLALFRSLSKRSRKWLVLTSGLILALLIGLEEFSQQYFADRTFSLMDLAASYLGVIFFSWLALRIARLDPSNEI
ncbi:MAG TPA: VanZ family protein [Anaerolineales bacterium]